MFANPNILQGRIRRQFIQIKMRRINVSIPFFQGAKEFLKIEPPNKKQNKLKIWFPEFFQFGIHVEHLNFAAN